MYDNVLCTNRTTQLTK